MRRGLLRVFIAAGCIVSFVWAGYVHQPASRSSAVGIESASAVVGSPKEIMDRRLFGVRASRSRRAALPHVSVRHPEHTYRSVTSGSPVSLHAILYCIRSYEGGYRSNTGNGYYGAYQFLQSTWDGVASRHEHRLYGVRPDLAAPADQDQMAAWLYQERGLQPWGWNARTYCSRNPPQPRQ
jgi:hypothetical protein